MLDEAYTRREEGRGRGLGGSGMASRWLGFSPPNLGLGQPEVSDHRDEVRVFLLKRRRIFRLVRLVKDRVGVALVDEAPPLDCTHEGLVGC